jgi:protein-L-isoaspartate(D-aspartate) O-methyltransferase
MDFAAARSSMIENQLRTNRISDPAVIRAIADTPRETYLPRRLRGIAYIDEDIAIGGGRVLIEPMVLARLLQEAGITASDVVLTLGDATGWASSVVSKLASTVVALDSDRDLLEAASTILAEQGVDTVATVLGDPAAGLPAQAPFDVIVIVGAVAVIPPALPPQLAEGGRLVAVLAPRPGTGSVIRLGRTGSNLTCTALFEAGTTYLPGLAPTAPFSLRP